MKQVIDYAQAFSNDFVVNNLDYAFIDAPSDSYSELGEYSDVQ